MPSKIFTLHFDPNNMLKKSSRSEIFCKNLANKFYNSAKRYKHVIRTNVSFFLNLYIHRIAVNSKVEKLISILHQIKEKFKKSPISFRTRNIFPLISSNLPFKPSALYPYYLEWIFPLNVSQNPRPVHPQFSSILATIASVLGLVRLVAGLIREDE